MNGTRSVLFLEKVLLKRKDAPVRGVEIFNLNLIRDLSRLGYGVTVPVHASWRPAIASLPPVTPIDVVAVSVPGGAMPNGLAAALRLAGRRFDVLLLANVATGLIPAIRLLHLLGVVPRTTLIAHREPSPRFVRAQARVATTVLAVNAKIASHFRGDAFDDPVVYYGVTDAAAYSPNRSIQAADGTVRFCVLGQLDNAWKGADTAVAAFRAIPDEVRGRCQLHLASFTIPPVFREKNIVAHGWMGIDEIPAFLNRMDVMLVPSRDEDVMRETFCQAMVQGMLCGLPVIASSLPVLAEKVDKGGGVVFQTVEECTVAMARLAESPQLREELGRQGRKTALERYVWDTAAFVEKFLFPKDAPPSR